MALRLMHIVFPDHAQSDITHLLEGQEILHSWPGAPTGKRTMVLVLVPAEQAEPIMDKLEQRLAGEADFHVVLSPVAAVLPRTEPETDEESTAAGSPQEQPTKTLRISREELYGKVVEGSSISRIFVAMVVLSSVVASIGLRRNDLAVIIGAMVIAPLLGPNVALALATTLGDASLARNALRTNVVGIVTALALSVAMGVILPVDPTVPAIVLRTQVSFGDIVLALAAGSAGALALTSSLSGAVIGVMVAVALMPPLVASGMLLGAGNLRAALGALLLTAVNVICVNLAGVATFLAQGVGPLMWWEAERAKKAARQAMMLWAGLLAVLAMILLLST
jgi:uncharacterized hydrophobic protein (TIGR00341 family)